MPLDSWPNGRHSHQPELRQAWERAKQLQLDVLRDASSEPAITHEVKSAARTLNVLPLVFTVRAPADLDRAFHAAVRERTQAMLINESSMLTADRATLVELAVSTSAASNRFIEILRGGRVADERRAAFSGTVCTGRALHRQDLERRQASRSYLRAADQVRARYQPHDREDARPYAPALAAGQGGSGDRASDARLPNFALQRAGGSRCSPPGR